MATEKLEITIDDAIKCVMCGFEVALNLPRNDAEMHLKRIGWTFKDGNWTCPTCKK